ncbi:MAG: hypothetical protein ABWY45_08715 [Mycobacterium sp.]
MSYLGYRDGDADTAWGGFFDAEMAPLPPPVVTALEHGPQADQTLLGFDDVATILEPGSQQTENGYGYLRGGGFQVSVRTAMPGVTPVMWDWHLGSTYTKAAIRFVEPASLGLEQLGEDLAVCARLGSSEVPVDIGWLVHHVRATADGAEMRSRFWLGGRHIGVRSGGRQAGNWLADNVIRPIAVRQLPDPRDLLVHCAQEMNHLAGFLPELHTQFS